jgi:antirestriction protein ArdC
MSTQFKPVSEQVSNKMITDIKSGNSIFQRPNNSMNSALPFNLESGAKYAGSTALTLLMQKRDDPRWATSNQANRNHTAVLKGATGTMISFHSTYAIQKVVDGAGEPVLKDNGKQRTERVKLDQPELVEAWMFNAEQMRKMEKWEKEPNILSPVERAEAILENSKVKIENGGDDFFYDPQTNIIVMPDKEQFAGPEQYHAEALHLMAHKIAVENRLSGPQPDIQDEMVHVKEELRTNLASFFLSKELNLPYDLNEHVGYLQTWSQIMKEDPGELFNAAADAQKIVDVVLKFEQQVEQKQAVAEVVDKEMGAETAPEFKADKLTKGEVIPHNGTEFKVLAELKNNVYQMQDLSDKRKFKMGSDSGLFASLLEARNNTKEIVSEHSQAEEFAAEQGNDNEVNNDYQIQR